jgi:hypothetical protein
LIPKIPTGLNHPAQRCRAAATLGLLSHYFIYPEWAESISVFR